MTDLTSKKPWKGERKDSGIFKKRHPHFHIVEIIMDFVDWLPPSGPMCFQKGHLEEANVTPSSDAQVMGGEPGADDSIPSSVRVGCCVSRFSPV